MGQWFEKTYLRGSYFLQDLKDKNDYAGGKKKARLRGQPEKVGRTLNV